MAMTTNLTSRVLVNAWFTKLEVYIDALNLVNDNLDGNEQKPTKPVSRKESKYTKMGPKSEQGLPKTRFQEF